MTCSCGTILDRDGLVNVTIRIFMSGHDLNEILWGAELVNITIE